MIQADTVIPASFRLPVLLLSLLLGACAATPPPVSAPVDSRPAVEAVNSGVAERSLGELLARAETLPSPESQRAYLEAADLLVELNRQEDALALLGAVNTRNLPPELTLDILLFQARLLIEGNRGQRALGLLNNLPVELGRLPAASQRDVRELRAQAHEASQQFLPAAQELINASNLLTRDELPAHHERIWSLLGALRAEELQELAGSALTPTFQGWYELAYVGKAYQYNLDRQLTELERWRQVWPRHPAANLLPAPLQMIQTLAAERPESLALLLPLATPAGQIIRDGFLTAYFEALSLGGQVPRLRLYDTTGTQDVRALVEQARADGAELIVGPLQKPLVDQLLDLGDLELPVLALNAVEGEQSRSGQVYQFALSPENEGRQIAERAWQDGHRQVAILSPREAPGEDYFSRKRDSFTARWQQLGGRVVQQESYGEDYTAVIERLLDLDESEARRAQLRQVLGRPLEFTQRRRQDIDFILLIASPATARQIKPSLAYLYAGDIPVYASQDIFSGLERPQQDRDLDGILFGDSPWLLDAADELKNPAQQLFPQDNALNLRLQAFGIDAFRLYSRLRQLESVPNSQLYGATGVLRMGPGQVIEQELHWARFNGGRVAPVDLAN